MRAATAGIPPGALRADIVPASIILIGARPPAESSTNGPAALSSSSQIGIAVGVVALVLILVALVIASRMRKQWHAARRTDPEQAPQTRDDRQEGLDTTVAIEVSHTLATAPDSSRGP